MSNPQLLAAELRRIRSEIIPVFMRPAEGWEKTDPQLERIETQLKRILREAGQQENFAAMQKWNAAPGTPQRWNAQQKERQSREVIEEALALQKEVERLIGPNLMEIGKNALENLEDMHKLQHQLHDFGAQFHAGVQVPSYLPQSPGGPHAAAGDPVVAAVSWVVLALQWWKQRKEKQALGVARA